MSRKSLAVLTALALASVAASADTINLSVDSPAQQSATFTSLSSGSTSYTFDLSGLGWTSINLTAVVTAGFSGSNGYDVTNVTLDGIAFTPVANVSVPGVFGVDAWTFSASGVSAGLHTLVVTGNLIGGADPTNGFSGKLTVQAVPEPESYALLLAGLAVIGAIARRRSSAR